MGTPKTQNPAHAHTRARAHEGNTFDVTLRAPPAPGDAIRTIARDVSRLSPDWRNPERYFEHRDEIAHALRLLARKLEAR